MSAMRYLPRLLAALVVLNWAELAPGQLIFGFEDLPPGTVYPPYVPFATQDTLGVGEATITPVEFDWPPWTSSGSVTVVTTGRAGGMFPQELWTNNINLAFDFYAVAGADAWSCCDQVEDLSFLFDHSGGNLNMGINGTFCNFSSFLSIPCSFPGVTVSVTPYSPTQGLLEIDGWLKKSQFSIAGSNVDANLIVGGQELWIDDVTFLLRGDFDGDGQLTAADIDILASAIRNGSTDPRFDLNSDTIVDSDDHRVWVSDLKHTWYGDADLDCDFDSDDFVQVFVEGKYETGQAAGWSQGDWNGDGVFETNDFVTAFVGGGYELGPRPCPEPGGILLLLSGLLGVMRRNTTARNRS